ncbi:MAG: cytochrome c [Hyphomicrobiaceae bacterium]|nr:MAG: cytochrome c [Hyphomicrobiaceae bacterium]
MMPGVPVASLRSVVVGTLSFAVAFGSRAADPKLEARGKAVLQEKCAHCHSIDAVGDSPLRIAPPMREICGRYLVRELHAELLEGKVSKYKEMPQVDFSPEDVDAILAYLYSLVAK